MIPKTQIIQAQDVSYILFDTHDYITQKLKLDGVFEPQLHEESQKLLDGHADGCVFDIGANLGSYTIPLAKRNPHLQFYSFEPQRHIYYQLCGNVILNSLDNVRTLNMAVGAKKDMLRVNMPNYVQCENIGGFKLDAATSNSGTEFVEVVTLDLLAPIKVRLIKIDVEGMEIDVIKGAAKTLIDNDYPPILFEAWGADWFTEERDKLFSYIISLGYRIRHLGENHIATKG